MPNLSTNWGKRPKIDPKNWLQDDCPCSQRFDVHTMGPSQMVPKIWCPNFGTIATGPEVYDATFFWKTCQKNDVQIYLLMSHGRHGGHDVMWRTLVCHRYFLSFCRVSYNLNFFKWQIIQLSYLIFLWQNHSNLDFANLLEEGGKYHSSSKRDSIRL